MKITRYENFHIENSAAEIANVDVGATAETEISDTSEEEERTERNDSSFDVHSIKLPIPQESEANAVRNVRSVTVASIDSGDIESGTTGLPEAFGPEMKFVRQMSDDSRYRVKYSKPILQRRRTLLGNVSEETPSVKENPTGQAVASKGNVTQTTTSAIVQESEMRKQKRSDFYKQQDVQVNVVSCPLNYDYHFAATVFI